MRDQFKTILIAAFICVAVFAGAGETRNFTITNFDSDIVIDEDIVLRVPHHCLRYKQPNLDKPEIQNKAVSFHVFKQILNSNVRNNNENKGVTASICTLAELRP